MALTPQESIRAAGDEPIAVSLALMAGFQYAKSVLQDTYPDLKPEDGWPDYPLSNFMQLMNDRAEEVVEILAGVEDA
jgi:hypothetical protein